jgi:transposase
MTHISGFERSQRLLLPEAIDDYVGPDNPVRFWLLRTLKPDFKTIADFRAENRDAFKAVFRAFTLLCKRLDLFGCELLAVDGTRIRLPRRKKSERS